MAKKSFTIFSEKDLDKLSKIGEIVSEYSKNIQISPAGKELDRLAEGSARVILDIKTVFPFDFFPDHVIADEAKVSVHTNYFFYTKEVRSIEYKEVFNVAVRQGLFFASLEIVDRFFSQDPVVVQYLWKKDAITARRIIQGMMIAKSEKIDTQSLPLDELVKKLERIGMTR